jgi:acetyl-CoA carboxylase biotin carboxyl carrier protein
VDLKDIRSVIELMRKNSISEFELEQNDFKIRMKRGEMVQQGTVTQPMYLPAPSPAALHAPATSQQASEHESPVPQKSNELEIKSPMIGTFYRSPTPDAAPYIEVGKEVDPEMVVGIIEAMKVMNEIKAETRGVITRVMIENGKPVEFGQPLFKYRPL